MTISESKQSFVPDVRGPAEIRHQSFLNSSWHQSFRKATIGLLSSVFLNIARMHGHNMPSVLFELSANSNAT